MTIQPKRDCFMVQCDTCPNSLRVDSVNFNDVTKTIKLKSWETYKNKNNERALKCPICQEVQK